ncbi:MAG: phosphotransferase [Lachnospiraceae bacterium]|nr:phosphotransferase [Lachnospiraceae bacterium]
MFEGISIAETFSKVNEISKGMSGDRKYYIETRDGKKLLLRITDISNYDTKKKDYDFLLSVNKADLPVPKAVDFGMCEDRDSVYMLLEWMEGEEAEKVVPTMKKDKQYSIGLKSGQILKGIHENSTINDMDRDWYARYFDVIQPRIEAYKNEGVPFEGADEILAFIEENKHLLHERRQCRIHGDFHLGNLIINEKEELFVIDWQTVDFEGVGDPWVDFINIGIEHPAFAAGQIDGYFNHQIPEAFWRMLALYLAVSAITSIVWAKYFAPERLESILELNKKVIKWYDGMNQVIPSWYKEYKVEFGKV